MAHAYSPGLKVVPLMVLRKKRMLPIPGKVLYQVGKQVNALDVVAQTELPGKVFSVNVANRLGVEPGEVRNYMLKKETDAVKKGEIIAETKPFLGLSFLKSSVDSPVTGTVESVSEITGQVLFREPPKILPLQAYIDGKIVEVEENFGVVIESEGTFIQGIFGIGGETNGEIKIAVDGPDVELKPEDIREEYRSKVIVGGKHASLDAIKKAIKVKASAVVVGGIHDKDLREILGYDIGVAVTGNEKIGITLVVTEGFGHIPMADYTFKLLKSREGERASVSGATQIRAGVMRPEIIIPGSPDKNLKRKEESRGWIEVGDQVRIIREPHFGVIGTVTSLPSELQSIPTESHVRVLEVKLDNGSKIVIPRANVEIVER